MAFQLTFKKELMYIIQLLYIYILVEVEWYASKGFREI